MFKKTKNILELTGNILRKLDELSHALDSHYFDKHDTDCGGNPEKKSFVHSSLRIKPHLTTSKLVRTDKHVANIYAVIAKKQEDGIRLLTKLKQKLTMEVTATAHQEVKALV